MKYLLNVNALLALFVAEHSLHDRTLGWVKGLVRSSRMDPLMTCSITELGFLRIACHAYGRTVEEGRSIIATAKASATVRFEFLADNHSAAQLPSWAVRSQQVTDGHLSILAHKHGAILATLDEAIPGSFLIPR